MGDEQGQRIAHFTQQLTTNMRELAQDQSRFQLELPLSLSGLVSELELGLVPREDLERIRKLVGEYKQLGVSLPQPLPEEHPEAEFGESQERNLELDESGCQRVATLEAIEWEGGADKGSRGQGRKSWRVGLGLGLGLAGLLPLLQLLVL